MKQPKICGFAKWGPTKGTRKNSRSRRANFSGREAPRFLVRLLGIVRAERLSKEVVFRHRHD